MAENEINVDVDHKYSIENLQWVHFQLIFELVEGFQAALPFEITAKEELLKAMREEYENGK